MLSSTDTVWIATKSRLKWHNSCCFIGCQIFLRMRLLMTIWEKLLQILHRNKCISLRNGNTVRVMSLLSSSKGKMFQCQKSKQAAESCLVTHIVLQKIVGKFKRNVVTLMPCKGRRKHVRVNQHSKAKQLLRKRRGRLSYPQELDTYGVIRTAQHFSRWVSSHTAPHETLK